MKICLERASDVIDEFIMLIKTNGRQAKYLDFFLVIQQVKEERLPVN